MVTKRERNNFRQEIKIAEHNVEEQENKAWDKTKEFYKGNHAPDWWDGDDFLVVNYIFANVVSQLPALSFSAPEYELSPTGNIAIKDKRELSLQKRNANIMEEILNRQRQQQEFEKHFRLATLDSLLSFGILKVFHKTRMGKNPKAGDPKTDSSGEPLKDRSGNIITEPDTIPTGTDFHVNRVKPENFLVDPRCGNFLESANWVAERVLMKTKKARKKFGSNDIPATGKLNADIEGDELKYRNPVKGLNRDSISSSDKDMNMSVMYEIYDTENNRRFYMAKGQESKVYKESEIPKEYREFNDSTPYVPLKHHEIPNQFYPIPDIFPATQINLSYDMARNQVNQYRKQFVQKYFVQEGNLEPDQLEKLESNQMGGVIKTKQNPAQQPPVQSFEPPRVPGAVFESLNMDLTDFRRISGITQSQMGQANPQKKATQTMQENQASQGKLQWKLMNIRDAAKKVGEKLVSLIQSYRIQSGVIYEPKNFDEDMIEFSPDKHLTGDFNVDVEFGSTQPDDQATKRQKFLNSIQTIGQLPQLLQHFDSRKLAEEFTKHFPIAKSAIRSQPDPKAFMNQGGGGSGPSGGQQGGSGGQGADQMRGQQGQNSPQPPDNGGDQRLNELISRIRGGMG